MSYMRELLSVVLEKDEGVASAARAVRNLVFRDRMAGPDISLFIVKNQKNQLLGIRKAKIRMSAPPHADLPKNSLRGKRDLSKAKQYLGCEEQNAAGEKEIKSFRPAACTINALNSGAWKLFRGFLSHAC